MASGTDEERRSLEAQLRNMILSNVTIAGGQANSRPPHVGPQQQNWRQNGPLNHSNQTHPNQSQNAGPPRGNSWRGRGSRGGSSHYQGNRNQMNSTVPDLHPAGSPTLLDSAQNAPNFSAHNRRHHQPRSPVQVSQIHPMQGTMQSGTKQRGQVQGVHQSAPIQKVTQAAQIPRANQVVHFQKVDQPVQENSKPRFTAHPRISKQPGQPKGPHGPENPPHSAFTNQRPSGYQAAPQPVVPHQEHYRNQVRYLDSLANQEIPKVEIPSAEIAEKEAFRSRLEAICRQALANGYSGDIATISLVGFGSLVSGFATPGSDMDLAIVPAWKDPAKAASNFSQIGPEIPRLLEKALMDAKFGVRLLTKTRVPILKVCENPSEELYTALCEERRKWDDLPDEEKYPPSPSLKAQDEPPKASSDVDGQKTYPSIHHHHHHHHHHSVSGPKGPRPDTDTKAPNEAKVVEDKFVASSSVQDNSSNKDEAQKSVKSVGTPDSFQDSNNNGNQQTRPHHEKHWFREKVLGPLDFPKFGVGIQCDINFSNPLALHNTHLLRCYSLCDPRVRPMVLFVKSWAKRRKINSSYSGTLSSYGYVLMVLHYLVNVAYPPVCPNLQLCWRAPTNAEEFAREMRETTIEGYSVRFWRNEAEIMARARAGELTQNNQSLGALLRGFFAYFASSPGPRNPQSGYGPPSFIWTSEVLSLRTPGGILKKHAKGWTGAKSTIVNGKEVRHRYLFAIEDPFEWDHNVGRTVQHHGIVAIRDEFRRAWRILQAVAWEREPEGGLFDEVVEPAPVVKRERPRAETEMPEGKEGDVEDAGVEVKGAPESAPERECDGSGGLSEGVGETVGGSMPRVETGVRDERTELRG